MTYEEIPPVLRRFLAAFEAYRRLGFRAADIYCQAARSVLAGGALSAFATLRTQGKEFAVECGPVESEEALATEYTRVSTAMNEYRIPEDVLERIWDESETSRRPSVFVSALINKGFQLPKAWS